MSTRNTRAPRAAQLAEHYRDLINTAADGYTPGSKMPSLRDVMNAHGVSVNVATSAYAALKSEGLIVTRPGSGTHVAARPRVVVTGAQRTDRIDAGGPDQLQDETVTDRWRGRRSVGDPSLAQALGVELHDEVAVRRRVFRKGTEAVCYALTVFHVRASNEVREILDNEELGDWRPLYEERTGLEIFRDKERRAARFASPDELKAFGLDQLDTDLVSVPVLITQTTFRDEQGPVMVMEDVYRPGTWQVEQ